MGGFEGFIAEDAEWLADGQRVGVEPLEDFLARCGSLAVAFSGGCDSSFLLAAALEAGCRVRAYLVRSAFQAAFERSDALSVAEALGIDLVEIDVDVLGDALLCSNTPNRCYLCKRKMLGIISQMASDEGFDVVADGTNASDDPRRRPGFRALGELGVVSPLRRAGMSKADVRDASKRLEARLGLSRGSLLAEKPSFPCLAVYVPEGCALTGESLAQAALGRGLSREDGR